MEDGMADMAQVPSKETLAKWAWCREVAQAQVVPMHTAWTLNKLGMWLDSHDRKWERKVEAVDPYYVDVPRRVGRELVVMDMAEARLDADILRIMLLTYLPKVYQKCRNSWCLDLVPEIELAALWWAEEGEDGLMLDVYSWEQEDWESRYRWRAIRDAVGIVAWYRMIYDGKAPREITKPMNQKLYMLWWEEGAMRTAYKYAFLS